MGILGFGKKKKKPAELQVTADEIAANAEDPGGQRAIQGSGLFDAMASGIGGLFSGTAQAGTGQTQYKRTVSRTPAQDNGFDLGGLLGGIGGAIGGVVGGIGDWAKENPEMFTGLTTGLIGTAGGSGLSGLQSFGAGGQVASQMGQQRAANELAMAKAQATAQGDMNKPFGVEQAKAIASSAAALQNMDRIKSAFASGNKGGLLGGGSREFRNARKQLKEELGRMQSGGAIGENELKTFGDLIPNSRDSDKVMMQKMETLRTKIQGRAALIDPTGRGQAILARATSSGGSQNARQYLR